MKRKLRRITIAGVSLAMLTTIDTSLFSVHAEEKKTGQKETVYIKGIPLELDSEKENLFYYPKGLTSKEIKGEDDFVKFETGSGKMLNYDEQGGEQSFVLENDGEVKYNVKLIEFGVFDRSGEFCINPVEYGVDNIYKDIREREKRNNEDIEGWSEQIIHGASADKNTKMSLNVGLPEKLNEDDELSVIKRNKKNNTCTVLEKKESSLEDKIVYYEASKQWDGSYRHYYLYDFGMDGLSIYNQHEDEEDEYYFIKKENGDDKNSRTMIIPIDYLMNETAWETELRKNDSTELKPIDEHGNYKIDSLDSEGETLTLDLKLFENLTDDDLCNDSDIIWEYTYKDETFGSGIFKNNPGHKETEELNQISSWKIPVELKGNGKYEFKIRRKRGYYYKQGRDKFCQPISFCITVGDEEEKVENSNEDVKPVDTSRPVIFMDLTRTELPLTTMISPMPLENHKKLIKMHSEGAEPSIQTVSIDAGHHVHEEDVIVPVREGYEFDGWYYKKKDDHKLGPNGSGESLVSFAFSRVVKEDMDFYAKWRKIDTQHLSSMEGKKVVPNTADCD